MVVVVYTIGPRQESFVGSVYRTETMRQLLCFKSKFPNHFAFTLGCTYVTCSCYFGSSLFNVDINYSHISLVNYSYFGRY